MLDVIDRAILRTLQANARTSNAQIARDLDLAPSAILERIRKLEDRGIIKGYAAIVDAEALDLGLTAFVLLRTSWSHSERVAAAIAAVPEVQELHHIAGEDCYILKVRAANPSALGDLLQTSLGSIEGIANSKTLVVLSTDKESVAFPIPDSGDTIKKHPTPISAIA